MARFQMNRKGFSLIELLIVIAIIGIIATIAIPILLSARVNAVNEKARNSLRSIVSAQAAYYAANGVYGEFTDLTASAPGVPPYLDTRFANGADIGQGIVVNNTSTGQGFVATAIANGGAAPYHTYTANETGDIVES